MNRADFQNLARIRLDEARALLAGGHSSGAYYLAGYAVECALKACIARQTQQHDFPPPMKAVQEMYTHDLTKLTNSAGLKTALDARLATDPVFNRFWVIVRVWSEQTRYRTFTQPQAHDLIQAIDDPAHGVLSWLQQHW